MLMILTVFFGFVTGLGMKKKLFYCLCLIIVSIFTILCIPSMLLKIEGGIGGYLHKGGAGALSSSIFESRFQPWKASFEGAIAGGWTGVGFGVSAGQQNFELGGRFTGSFYGREKGNSQLAVIEETGIAGFVLYLMVTGTIFYKCLNLYFHAVNQDQKVLAGIVSGTFAGLFAISVFEAWWNSGGSPEGIYFWLLAGVLQGLQVLFRSQKQQQGQRVSQNFTNRISLIRSKNS